MLLLFLLFSAAAGDDDSVTTTGASSTTHTVVDRTLLILFFLAKNAHCNESSPQKKKGLAHCRLSLFFTSLLTTADGNAFLTTVLAPDLHPSRCNKGKHAIPCTLLFPSFRVSIPATWRLHIPRLRTPVVAIFHHKPQSQSQTPVTIPTSPYYLPCSPFPEPFSFPTLLPSLPLLLFPAANYLQQTPYLLLRFWQFLVRSEAEYGIFCGESKETGENLRLRKASSREARAVRSVLEKEKEAVRGLPRNKAGEKPERRIVPSGSFP